MSKNVKLIIAVSIVVIGIGFLEYSKNNTTVEVAQGSADIPIGVSDINGKGASSSATGQCTTEYCTTTTSTQSAALLNSKNGTVELSQVKSDSALKSRSPEVYLSIAEKSKKYERAKEITSPDGFINSPNGKGGDGQTGSAPFKIADMIGKKIIVVDFWTYSCINCQRTLPYMNAWYSKYKDAGLEIIGVETPEFDFEKSNSNVRAAVEKYGIKYPVVQDNRRGTWNAYQNLYWPRKYIIDIDGFIVYDHIGEGAYDETEQVIQKLLKEKAARSDTVLDFKNTVTKEVAKTATVGMLGISPETYFGAYRNTGFVGNTKAGITSGDSGDHQYTLPKYSDMSSGKFYLGGTWNIMDQFIESAGTPQAPAVLAYKYKAKNVYLVADTINGKPMTVDIYQDGAKIKTLKIQGASLYHLMENPDVESHVLEIRVSGMGLEAYTFTFG